MSSPPAGRVAEQAGHACESKLEGIRVEHLAVTIRGRAVISDVGLSLRPGRIAGLVGESGSGKSLTGLAVIGLLPPGSHATGSVRLGSQELLGLDAAALRAIRGQRISMIFQDPVNALNPSLSVGRQIVQVIRAHERLSWRAAAARAVDGLRDVGLPQPRKVFFALPHELSGGMCQRVMIAMALACDPEVLIADEPTTALDATVQAQIMALLTDVVAERGISILLISHDLALVSDVCDDVIAMYCGEVVAEGTATQMRTAPPHPYPWALQRTARIDLAAGPEAVGISGRPADPSAPPPGCRFHPRCTFVADECTHGRPALVRTENGALTRCIRHAELDLSVTEYKHD